MIICISFSISCRSRSILLAIFHVCFVILSSFCLFASHFLWFFSLFGLIRSECRCFACFRDRPSWFWCCFTLVFDISLTFKALSSWFTSLFSGLSRNLRTEQLHLPDVWDCILPCRENCSVEVLFPAAANTFPTSRFMNTFSNSYFYIFFSIKSWYSFSIFLLRVYHSFYNFALYSWWAKLSCYNLIFLELLHDFISHEFSADSSSLSRPDTLLSSLLPFGLTSTIYF